MTNRTESLIGDAALLGVERAIAELRAGRPLRVIDATGGARLVLAVDTLRRATLDALSAARGRGLRLATTAERARALGSAVPTGADVSFELDSVPRLDELRALAGAAPLEPAAFPSTALAATDADAFERSAIALAKHARLLPTLLCAPGDEPRDPRLLELPITALARYEDSASIELERVSEAAVPLADAGRCRFVVLRDRRDGSEHVAVMVGDVDPAAIVDVRVHSACLTGDLFGSMRCDCGDQLRGAIRRFAALGAGVLLYVAQEGRGIGLANKLRAYRLQEQGLDTIDANLELGFAADERRYAVAARVLRELGIGRIRLHTNNTRKVHALTEAGIEVVGLRTLAGAENAHNAAYIRVRRERAGHLVPVPD